MLVNIKSLYFLKIVLLHIKERRKLELIKYNKSLQKKVYISLINYKIFCGKNLMFEENGKVKEYNCFNDKLIYEGEYLNWKRHGKGKEYNCRDDSLKFEGEYLNGKRWNGKIIFENKEYELKYGNGFVRKYEKYFGYYDYVMFEGEYQNGEKNGKGKEYYINGLKIFEGEYLNGKRWNGKIIFFDEKELNNKSYSIKKNRRCIFIFW